MISELGPPQEEKLFEGIDAWVGATSGKMVVPDRDCASLSDDNFKELLSEEIGEFTVPQEESWEIILKSRITTSGNTRRKGSTIPKLDLTNSETNREIKKFESLIHRENMGLLDEAKEDTELKSFLRSLAEELHKKYNLKAHMYYRMIWITDHSCIYQNAEVLKAFVLCSSILKRGEYHVAKKGKDSTKKKSDMILLNDLLGLGTDDCGSDDNDIVDTQRGFNKDINEFEKLLSWAGLSLDNPTACSNKMGNGTEFFYEHLRSIANIGRKNRMPFHVYRRMRVVLSRTSSWPMENVLKAFFMSMCRYTRDKENEKQK